jgi:hypothetical protein
MFCFIQMEVAKSKKCSPITAGSMQSSYDVSPSMRTETPPERSHPAPNLLPSATVDLFKTKKRQSQERMKVEELTSVINNEAQSASAAKKQTPVYAGGSGGSKDHVLLDDFPLVSEDDAVFSKKTAKATRSARAPIRGNGQAEDDDVPLVSVDDEVFVDIKPRAEALRREAIAESTAMAETAAADEEARAGAEEQRRKEERERRIQEEEDAKLRAIAEAEQKRKEETAIKEAEAASAEAERRMKESHICRHNCYHEIYSPQRVRRDMVLTSDPSQLSEFLGQFQPGSPARHTDKNYHSCERLPPPTSADRLHPHLSLRQPHPLSLAQFTHDSQYTPYSHSDTHAHQPNGYYAGNHATLSPQRSDDGKDGEEGGGGGGGGGGARWDGRPWWEKVGTFNEVESSVSRG